MIVGTKFPTKKERSLKSLVSNIMKRDIIIIRITQNFERYFLLACSGPSYLYSQQHDVPFLGGLDMGRKLMRIDVSL